MTSAFRVSQVESATTTAAPDPTLLELPKASVSSASCRERRTVRPSVRKHSLSTMVTEPPKASAWLKELRTARPLFVRKRSPQVTRLKTKARASTAWLRERRGVKIPALPLSKMMNHLPRQRVPLFVCFRHFSWQPSWLLLPVRALPSG